jgi:hypothetical protein
MVSATGLVLATFLGVEEGDEVAAPRQLLGELEEGDDVAKGEPWEHHHVKRRRWSSRHLLALRHATGGSALRRL